MALLVDGSWCKVEDLQAYDGSATSVAAEEGIDLGAKLELSEAWITDSVDDFLRWESIGGQSLYPQSGLSVGNAVVDDRLRRWHLMHTLALLYRDASFSQVSDRFQSKWEAYEKDAAQMKAEYFRSGVACVSNPLRKPAAPTVEVTPGQLPAAVYFISLTQVDGSQAESAGSEVIAVQAAGGNGLTVTANQLAAGNRWNVYAADNNGVLRRQNDMPMDADFAWTIPEAGLVAGAPIAQGQAPDSRVKERRILPRG